MQLYFHMGIWCHVYVMEQVIHIIVKIADMLLLVKCYDNKMV